MPAKFQMSTQTVAIVAIEFYYWKGRVYITSLEYFMDIWTHIINVMKFSNVMQRNFKALQFFICFQKLFF